MALVLIVLVKWVVLTMYVTDELYHTTLCLKKVSTL